MLSILLFKGPILVLSVIKGPKLLTSFDIPNNSPPMSTPSEEATAPLGLMLVVGIASTAAGEVVSLWLADELLLLPLDEPDEPPLGGRPPVGPPKGKVGEGKPRDMPPGLTADDDEDELDEDGLGG